MLQLITGRLYTLFKNHNLNIILLLVLGGTFLFGQDLPLGIKNIFYTISTSLKNILLFLLPCLVIPFIATSMLQMRENGAILVLIIFVGVILSTFTAIFFAYGVSHITFETGAFAKSTMALVSKNDVCNIFDLNVDPFFSIEIALLLGLTIGMYFSYNPNNTAIKWIKRYRQFSTSFFTKIFMPLLPLYIFGLLLKLQHDGNCEKILHEFQTLIMWIGLSQIFYILMYFILGNRFNIFKAFDSIANAFPAALTAFSSISSVVAMPLTQKAAEKNTKDKSIADLTIPATVNVHALGDAIALPFFAIAIYFFTYKQLPPFEIYVLFALLLTVAQFGAISVAGGSVYIILPLLEQKLGFTAEMGGLLTAIYLFVDPWSSACNVMGNSGFVMIIHRINGLRKRFKKKG